MKTTMTATPAQALNDLQRPALIRDVAQQLCDIEEDKLKRGDSASWGKATIYVTSYPLIAEELKAAGEKASPQNINKMIRQEYVDDDGAQREGPGASWLSHALRTWEEFPEVFVAGYKKTLPYEAYKVIANSRLKPEDKAWLREEAERRVDLPKTDEEHYTRKWLREEVRRLSQDKPHWLKTSNWWLFNMEDLPGQWDGGIHFGYYANLIHYFTDPGDTVLDPCAGSGKLQATLDAHFAEVKEGWDFSGPRRALMYDLCPRYEGIQQADMRELAQAAGEGVADLIICDPPYYGIADGKYDNLGDDIGDWVLALHQSVQELAKVLKPDGHLALIVDDYLRSNEFQPLGMYCAQACHSAGLEPAAVVYGNSPHFVTSMNAMQMARAKKARLMCNQSKVVNVWRKPND
jgi:SAM-dependent methyltransferase